MGSVELIYLSSTNLASVELVGPYCDTVPRAWGQLFDWLTRSQNHEKPGRGYGLAFDDPRAVPAAACRYMAGVVIPAGWKACDKNIVNQYRFSGGAYAWRQHRGDYGHMGGVVSSVREDWLPANGLMLDAARPVVTIYYDDPRLVPGEHQFADICVPVQQDRRIKPRT